MVGRDEERDDAALLREIIRRLDDRVLQPKEHAPVSVDIGDLATVQGMAIERALHQAAISNITRAHTAPEIQAATALWIDGFVVGILFEQARNAL